MTYYTYILQCADGSFYIGYTTDLKQRLEQHNGTIKGGAKYTRSRKPVFLLHYEQFETKQSAMKREYELKQLTRKQKEDLCNLIPTK
ncbi:MAG TPA: GIY-YIG nuclease family protein [Candidatus Saccharimonadales bacterium]|nr:GIY-YIG nuclease family protein [Candidatus Saccharimonadales bacterium]